MSKKDRKAAEEIILKGLSLIDPSGVNTTLTKEFFAGMSDQQFYNYIEALRNKKDYVSVVMPNLNKKVKVTTDNNLKIAPKFGVDFFQRIWVYDPLTNVKYLTPKKYLVMHLPVRRQIQTLESKMSVPKHRKSMDDLTHQVTGNSASSSISQPETLVLISKGQIRTAEELLKVRGGDLKALNYSEQSTYATGGYSLDVVAELPSRNKAVNTLSTYLLGMHYDNTF